MGKITDLTGQKFGKLTVVKLTQKENGKSCWECLCECGTTKLCSTSGLKTGDNKSCGCLKKSKIVDITGKKFGRLTALRRTGTRNNNAIWKCSCECGVIKEYYITGLRSGTTQSCGCLQIELTIKRSTTHGHSTRKNTTVTYNTWSKIIDRCENEKNKHYGNYGGRGIKVCERWRKSYENFLEDMGERPGDQYSIDRINNEKDYEPGNCRWTTRSEQNRNTRRNIWVEYMGKKMIIEDWAKEYNIPQKTLWYRVRQAGWTMEKALNTPVRSQNK